ncbi:MAG: HIT family protein [Nocardia sp.]|nr:HIT family protein [Nocardia sp.]
MSGCIFCRIVAGQAPATPVYEDERIYAFLDIRPITRGHTLVIPKTHAADLDELDAELGAELFRVGHRIAKALPRGGLGSDGANLLINNGRSAFQTVHHVHLHVIPRRRGDLLTFARGLLLRRPHEPAATATALRTGLDRLRESDADAPEKETR